jgi:DNA-binding NarL/FixJ family response regulator
MRVFESLPEPNPIRVVLIDEQQLFRAGIRSILSRGGDMMVAGEAGNRTEALAMVQREQPDVVLMDLSVTVDDDFSLIRELMAASESTKILILTAVQDGELQRKAVRLGAKGLLSKDASAEVLIKAVQRVQAGEVWLDRSTTAAVFDEWSRGKSVRQSPEETKIAALTDREREVIRAVGEGLKNKQIGERLFISDVTVRHHLTSVFSKLGVKDRLELVIYAYRHGLASIPQ